MVTAPELKTPAQQLDMLCRVIGNPALPLQQLNRVLQCRMAWRRDKGLPPTYRRALLTLAAFALPIPEPVVTVHTQPAPVKKTRAKVLVDVSDGLLDSSVGGHTDA